MKKSELIEMVAERAQESKAAVGRVVDAIFDAGNGAIAEAVKAGKEVSIPGFGKFRSKKRAARKGRNPQTGKQIDIPESTVVSFSPGKSFKDSIAGRGTARKTGSAGSKAGASRGSAKTGAARTGGGRTAAGAKAAGAKSASGSRGTAAGGAKSGGAKGSAGAKRGGTKR
jgi:DNA-binding protein HU-beta